MFRMPVDLESSLVDDHLVVVPAEGDQIVRVGPSSLRPGDEVVDLESVATGAPVGSTCALVAVEDGPS